MIKTLDPKRSASILANNYIGYLSYISQNRPFTIPITYFYNEKENYTLSHFRERINIYGEEDFDYEIHNIELNNAESRTDKNN